MKTKLKFSLLILTVLFFVASCAGSPEPEKEVDSFNIKELDNTDTYDEKLKTALNYALDMKRAAEECRANILYQNEYNSAGDLIKAGKECEYTDKSQALKNYEDAAQFYITLTNLKQAHDARSIIIENQYQKNFPNEYAQAEKLYEQALSESGVYYIKAVQKSKDCLLLYKKIINENTALLAEKAIKAAETAEKEAWQYALQVDSEAPLYDDSICVDEP